MTTPKDTMANLMRALNTLLLGVLSFFLINYFNDSKEYQRDNSKRQEEVFIRVAVIEYAQKNIIEYRLPLCEKDISEISKIVTRLRGEYDNYINKKEK